MCYRTRASVAVTAAATATDYCCSSCCSYCSSSCHCYSTTTTTTNNATPAQVPTVAQPVGATVVTTTVPTRHYRHLPYQRTQPSLNRMLLLALVTIICYCCCLHTVQCGSATVWDDTISDASDSDDGTFLMPADPTEGGDQQQQHLSIVQRVVRRIPEQMSASRGPGWRKRRYYVGRWASGAGGIGSQRRRAAGRRYVPVSNSDDDERMVEESNNEQDDVVKQQQRLCGLKLTNRTKQLCGDCVPANMRQVILLDKKHGQSGSRSGTSGASSVAFSKERLTEMCCVQRCTDEQIRNFCCRGRT